MSLPGPDGHSDLKQSIYEAAVRQLSSDSLNIAMGRFFERVTERQKNPKLDLSDDDRAFLKSIGVSAE